MKQYVIIAVVCAFLVIGCIFALSIDSVNQPQAQVVDGMVIKRIDGCQYLINYVYRGNEVYTHKGNCDNPIHIYREPK